LSYPWCVVRYFAPREIGVRSVGAQAYRRGDMRDKRRRLMSDWASFAANHVAASRSEIIAIRPGIADYMALII